MDYQHRMLDGSKLRLPTGKVVCIGRNYIEHINELNNEKPEAPVLFIKPTTSMVSHDHKIKLPKHLGICHYEVEITVLMTATLSNVPAEALSANDFYFGVGLDLTLRDIQKDLKEKGLPWEKAKAFDGACVLSRWVDGMTLSEAEKSNLSLRLNGAVKQKACASEMMVRIGELISYASQFFTLLPGDVLMTGTPSGVGRLDAGDQLLMSLNQYEFAMEVAL